MGDRLDALGERIDRINAGMRVWFDRLFPWLTMAFVFPMVAAALLFIWGVIFVLVFHAAGLLPEKPATQQVQAEAP